MHTPETVPQGALSGTFQTAYGEARRLILKHHDLDAATDCLRQARPNSMQESWLRTDLLGTLLLRTGLRQECDQLLAAHKARYPDDPRIDGLIQTFRKHNELNAPAPAGCEG